MMKLWLAGTAVSMVFYIWMIIRPIVEEGLAECQAAHEAERASFEARELKALRERDALRTQVAELVAALEDIESYNVQGLSMTAHIALRNYRAAMPKEQE